MRNVRNVRSVCNSRNGPTCIGKKAGKLFGGGAALESAMVPPRSPESTRTCSGEQGAARLMRLIRLRRLMQAAARLKNKER